MDSSRTPVLKYKIYCHDEEWLPKGEGNGIKLWKEDSEGRSLWPRGVPDAVKPETMCHLPKVVKGLSEFIDHWERSSEESIESRRLNEPLSYYWRDVRDALSLPMDTPISLQNGFWPSTRIAHAVEDEFTEEGHVREEYGEDDHFVGHRCDRPPPSFRIGRDLYAGYFVALRPSDGDDRPFWIAQAMSDPNSNPERPNTVQIQFFRHVSWNRDVLKFYEDWDTNVNLQWTIEKGVAITWESTNSILTAWKSRAQKQDGSHSQDKAPTTKIP